MLEIGTHISAYHTGISFCSWISYQHFLSLKIYQKSMFLNNALENGGIEKKTFCTMLPIKANHVALVV
jgi:hypothetical protein